MNLPPQADVRPQSAVLISGIVVVNIIWGMVMIAAIGLGATHLGRCPVQPYIPIYLIVLGAASLLAVSLTYGMKMWDDGFACILCSFCTTILHLFTFGWLIAGSRWVYPVYPPNYTPGSDRFCQWTIYQFAFCVTTLVWFAMAGMFICGCCCGLLTCCTTVTARHRLIPARISFYGTMRDEAAAGDV